GDRRERRFDFMGGVHRHFADTGGDRVTAGEAGGFEAGVRRAGQFDQRAFGEFGFAGGAAVDPARGAADGAAAFGDDFEGEFFEHERRFDFFGGAHRDFADGGFSTTGGGEAREFGAGSGGGGQFDQRPFFEARFAGGATVDPARRA